MYGFKGMEQELTTPIGHVNSDEIIFELKICVICKKPFTQRIKDGKKHETCPLKECCAKYSHRMSQKKQYDKNKGDPEWRAKEKVRKSTPKWKVKAKDANKKYYDEHKDKSWFKEKTRAASKKQYEKNKNSPEIIFELKICVICEKPFTQRIKDGKKHETCPLPECCAKYSHRMSQKKRYGKNKDDPEWRAKAKDAYKE